MQSVYKLKGDTSDFDAKIRKSKQNLTQFASHGKLGMEGMTKAIGASIASFASWTAALAAAGKVVGDMVRINKEFEQSNANLAAVLGTTRDQITTLTEDAKRLGASTMYTASQVTDLQTSLAKLGFNQVEIKNSTKDVLNFAAATGADLGGAADLCGAALRAFGLDAKDMGRVASSMAVATSKSALSYEKLASSLSTVAPVANKFGFTIEDTLALLGKLSDAGFDASSAATATRNIFLNMADSSGKLAVALGRPIKSLDDLAPALGELQAKGIDLAEMLNLTDKRSVAAFATLVSGNDTLITLRDSITDCSDALQGMVNEQMNTLHGSTLILQSAWEGLMLSFSNSNGVIKGVVDELSALISNWTRWRNIRAGGDSALAASEIEVTDASRATWKSGYESMKSKTGASDKQMASVIAKNAARAQKEYDDLKKILYYYYSDDKHGVTTDDIRALGKDVRVANYTVDGGYQRLIDDLGKKKSNVDMYAYWGELANPKAAEAEVEKANKNVLTAEEKLATRILQIKNQEAKDIAAIDRQKFSDAEAYENEVYRIKRESLMKQRELYAAGGDKWIATDTAIANLDTQHQARLNRGFGSASTKVEPIEYAPGTLGALRQELQEARECLNECVIDSEAWVEQMAEVVRLTKAVGDAEAQITPKAVKTEEASKGTMDAWQNASIALTNAGAAMNALDDPAAKVAGTLAQAVASIMLGFAQASASPATGAAGVFGWIAAVTAGLATAIATVSTIKSVGNYAEGGIVPGNSYSGDNLIAHVNSGEGILTAQGVRNLGALYAGQAGASAIQVTGRISGRDILLAADADNRSRGGSRGYYARTR